MSHPHIAAPAKPFVLEQLAEYRVGSPLATVSPDRRSVGERTGSYPGRFQDVPIALVTVDLEGNITGANERAAQLFQSTQTELQGRTLESLCPESPAGRERARGMLARARQGEAIIGEELEIRRMDETTGRPLVVGRLAGELRPEDAEIQLWMVDVRSAAADRLVASVSHELKTPLAVISGFVDLLIERGADFPDATRSQYLGLVRSSLRRLDVLVDDLLETALRPGELRLDMQDLALHEILNEVAEGFGALSVERSQTVTVDPLPEAVIVRADAVRVSQALTHLIDNAMKYSPPGAVIRVGLNADPREVRIAVADDGPGIPSEQQAWIFERFTRMENAETLAVPGMGLGLWRVRAIVRAHGGAVSVDSTPGEGSTFVIALPRA